MLRMIAFNLTVCRCQGIEAPPPLPNVHVKEHVHAKKGQDTKQITQQPRRFRA